MFERYTERGRRALFFARYEASLQGSPAITPQHLLLAIARDGAEPTRTLLARANLSLVSLREQIGSAPIAGAQAGGSDHIPFEQTTKDILTFAAEEADRLQQHDIGSEHLLLAILRGEPSKAADVLISHGVSLASARELIARSESDKIEARAVGARIASSTKRFEDGTSTRRDLDQWSLEGLYLRPLLSHVYGMLETRIDLPPGLDAGERYDCSLAVAPGESSQTMERLMQRAIEEHFGITVKREMRPTNVYVLTAPKGDISAPKEAEVGGGGLGAFSSGTFDLPIDPSSSQEEARAQAIEHFKSRFKAFASGAGRGQWPIGSVSASTSLTPFCEMLERSVDRPVIDETNLMGQYRIDIQSEGKTTEEFFRALEERLGLVATATIRDVTMLVVRRQAA